MKRLRAVWENLWEDVDRRVRLGRVVGLGFVVVGFFVIGKAWDGAANLNYLPAQFPYLLSGGFMGLGLVVFGSVLLFLASIRAERQELTDRFQQVAELLGRNLSRLQATTNGQGPSTGTVVAAKSVYHLPGCKVLEGKPGLTSITVEQATSEGLTPCRVCRPPVASDKAEIEISAASETPGP